MPTVVEHLGGVQQTEELVRLKDLSPSPLDRFAHAAATGYVSSDPSLILGLVEHSGESPEGLVDRVVPEYTKRLADARIHQGLLASAAARIVAFSSWIRWRYALTV